MSEHYNERRENDADIRQRINTIAYHSTSEEVRRTLEELYGEYGEHVLDVMPDFLTPAASQTYKETARQFHKSVTGWDPAQNW